MIQIMTWHDVCLLKFLYFQTYTYPHIYTLKFVNNCLYTTAYVYKEKYIFTEPVSACLLPGEILVFFFLCCNRFISMYYVCVSGGGRVLRKIIRTKKSTARKDHWNYLPLSRKYLFLYKILRIWCAVKSKDERKCQWR